MATVSERLTGQQALLADIEARGAQANSPGAVKRAASGAESRWLEIHADEYADAIVQSLAINGVDYLFFSSGSDIGFYQEAVVKARSLGRQAPQQLLVDLQVGEAMAGRAVAGAEDHRAARAQQRGSGLALAGHSEVELREPPEQAEERILERRQLVPRPPRPLPVVRGPIQMQVAAGVRGDRVDHVVLGGLVTTSGREQHTGRDDRHGGESSSQDVL